MGFLTSSLIGLASTALGASEQAAAARSQRKQAERSANKQLKSATAEAQRNRAPEERAPDLDLGTADTIIARPKIRTAAVSPLGGVVTGGLR